MISLEHGSGWKRHEPNELPLVGRDSELSGIGGLLARGLVVVLYGRVGAGKSALLRALAQRTRRQGRPCGLASRTASLADFTGALACAYPGVPTDGTQRQIRGRLRRAMEARPGVLLLDGLGETGTAFKGVIKSVRGTGVGIVLAADVDQPRDHQRLRTVGLSHYELALRPLHGNSMRALLQALIEQRTLAYTVTPEHVRALVAAAEGLPGRAVDFADALIDPLSWSAGNPRVDWLRTGSAIRAAERYRQSAPRTKERQP
jgi:energy-coupling factor transporter ATP-binding protein EcfA2